MDREQMIDKLLELCPSIKYEELSVDQVRNDENLADDLLDWLDQCQSHVYSGVDNAAYLLIKVTK